MTAAAPVPASDEGRHAPGPEPLWSESWYFDWAQPDGNLGGYVRLGLYPNLGIAWYWGCLVGEGRPLVTVIDHEVPIPASGLEIRTEGLWAAHNVETPLDHWSLGCESFAVGVDDPAEAYGDLRGDRVPLGLDLEWETDGGVYPYPGVDRYEVPCRVHGEVLVGQERIEVDGSGQRDHSWGGRDWWTDGWTWTSSALDDGTRTHATHVASGDGEVCSTGYVQAPGGTPEAVARVAGGQDLGREGLPDRGWVRLDDLELAIEPLHFSPVLLTGPEGQTSRLPRALCRYRVGDGRTGVGWTEWNQPTPPG